MNSFKRNKRHVSDNKFIFNGHNLSNMVLITNIKRTILPALTNSNKTIPGLPGSVLSDRNIGNRQIIVDVAFVENSKNEILSTARSLSGKLFSEKAEKLELIDSDLYNYATLIGTSEIEFSGNVGKTTLTFECNDPFNYGAIKTERTSTEFINDGFLSDGKIICETNATNVIQVKQRGKTKITINHNIVMGNELIIDLKSQVILLNGYSIMKYVSLESDFFKIDPGLNKIEIVGAKQGTIEYQERWL